jgi:hypothetical protein
MHSKREAVQTAVETPGLIIRAMEAGAMTIETGDVKEEMDVAPLFAGLPDDSCQCEHWGYVIEGAITFRFKDRTEKYSAGEVYYAEPGHTPIMHAGLKYIEYSPTDALNQTMEVAMGNAARLGLV